MGSRFHGNDGEGLYLYAVDAGGGVVEEGGAFGGGVAFGHELEGVVEDVVGVGDLSTGNCFRTWSVGG